MSKKERIVRLLDDLPESEPGYVLAFVQGLTADTEINEAEDDLFCQKLVQNYLNDPDSKNDNGISLEECKKEWGIN